MPVELNPLPSPRLETKFLVVWSLEIAFSGNIDVRGKETSRAVTLHIGAIVNTNSRIGREQKIAIEIASKQFNSTTTLLLHVSKSSSSRSSQLRPISDAKNLIKWGAEVIVSTVPWPEVDMVAVLGSQAKIPVLSLAANPPLALAPRRFLVRMSYPDSGQMECLADLVKSYNWRRVIAVYEDDAYGSISATIARFSGYLRDVGSDIAYGAAFPPMDSLPDPKAAVRQELERVRRQLPKVYIIVRASSLLAVHLFQEAKKLGMMAKGHVWIINDDISTLFDSALMPSFLSSYMQGVVGIKIYFNEATDYYGDFRTKFRRRYESSYGKVGERYVDPGFFALRAYDALRVIACAASETVKQRKTLLEGILSCKFTGLSGPISFRRDGSFAKGKGTPAFQVVNVVGKSYKELGFWVEGSGFFKEEGDMGLGRPVVDVLGPVYWPGGPWTVPGGWGRLRIGVPARTSFDQFVKVEHDETGKVRAVTGFCIDVFKETLKRLKYDLEYEFIPFHGTYDDLISRVSLKEFDAVVGDVTILAERSANVTFTEPFLVSGLSMLVRVKPDHKTLMLTKPFSKAVWILIFSTLIYTGIIIWYIEHRRNPEFHGPWWTQLGATLWLMFSSIVNRHGMLNSYYTRTLVIPWLFAVLILTSSYTATLSSIMTVQKLEPMVDNGRVGCNGDSFVVKYLQDVLGYKEKMIVKLGAEENYPKAFESGNITAAYLEIPYLRLFLSRHDGYTVYGETHRLGGFGFAFQKGSPIAADISEAILELAEDGIMKQLEKKWFFFSLSNCPSPDNNYSKTDSLSLDHFWQLFLFTGGTSTTVFLLFVARLIQRRLTSHQQADESPRERFRRLWRSLISKIKKIWRSMMFWGKNEAQLSSLPITSAQEENGISTGSGRINNVESESHDNDLMDAEPPHHG
ncbi:glutamate receptor 2.3-like [Elaeis guineensis]|uniref:glutamate receptor 2.3-like n=1 Tax=Elaeis guineensis var. tenera TaxID=51953 RepID=UPI003C6CEF7C